MARDLIVTYGGLVIGGGTDRQPASVYRSNLDFETGQATIDFVVASEQGVDLAAERAAIEAETTRLNQPFKIEHSNGQVWLEWAPGAGYTTRADLSKPGDTADTDKSRYYRLTVTTDVPAVSADDDGNPREGRRPPVVTLAYDDDRRRSVTISGEYTATGGGGTRVPATTNYETHIDALVAAVLPGDADRWLCALENREADELDGVCRYTLTFREVTTDTLITYGDITVGDTAYPLADGVQVLRGYERLSVSFDVEVPVQDARETGSTSWYQAAETLEAAFRKPRQDLRIAVGGFVVFEGEQLLGTIIDAEPNIQRVGDPAIAGPLSRTFRVTIEAGLPADNLDAIEGRREADISVQYDGARRRTMTITGTYTSTATNARAEDAYVAAIAAYTTSVQTEAGGLWELVEESRDQFETGLQLQFSRTFQELFYSEQADPNVVEQRSSVVIITPGARDSSAPSATGGQSTVGGGSAIEKLRTARATIQAKVDHDEVSTEAEYDALALGLLNWLVARINEVANASALAVTSTDVDYQRDGWDVTATVEAEFSQSGGWIEFKRSITRNIVTGQRVVPAWGGNRYSGYRYQGIGEIICTISDTGLHLASLPSYDAPEPPIIAGAADFALVGQPQENYEKMIVGQAGYEYTVFFVQRSWQYQQFAAISTQAPAITGSGAVTQP